MILAGIKSCHLEALRFNIFISDTSQLDQAAWDSYDDLFGHCTQFGHLRRLIFNIAVEWPVETIPVEDNIRKRLPRCNRRGILVF